MFTADGYQPSIRAGKRGIDAPWEHQPAETEHLGSGHGHSVLKVLEAFGLAISYVGTPEKGRSTAAQLVRAIEIR